jgi:hypothetical protein
MLKTLCNSRAIAQEKLLLMRLSATPANGNGPDACFFRHRRFLKRAPSPARLQLVPPTLHRCSADGGFMQRSNLQQLPLTLEIFPASSSLLTA